jgi:hypothetical protein
MKSIFAFFHRFFKRFADFFERLAADKPVKQKEIPPPSDAESNVEITAHAVEPKREISEKRRRLLMMLAKDELSDSEKQEMDELMAGKEIIILEDS